MKRPLLVLFAFTAVLPLSAQRPDSLSFLRRAGNGPDLLFERARENEYRAVRGGEVRAAPFLTEMRAMPFGKVLGPTEVAVVRSTQNLDAVLPGAMIGVLPPAGAAYQRGDTILLAELLPGPRGMGNIVMPTGLAVVGDHSPRQTVATVVRMYGPMRGGQVTMPVEPFVNPGAAAEAPVSGPAGVVLGAAEQHELEQVGDNLFIDQGRAAGMRVGDFVQVRRRAGPRPNNADTIDDLMAVAQVVHVGEKSATIKLLRVLDPAIRPGTPVVRVATLQG